MLTCRLLGHRPRFWNEGATMRWECRRCGQAAGAKDYPSAADAQRYAEAFDREDRNAMRRGPVPLSLLPLRIFRRRQR